MHASKPHDIEAALAALSSTQFVEKLRSVARGRIHYTVWSDVFSCNHCGAQLTYWSEAVDVQNGKIRESFPCPKCKVILSKRSLDRVWDAYFDPWLGRIERTAKAVPVLINYIFGGKSYEKAPDKLDLALVEKVRSLRSVPSYPTDQIKKGDKTAIPLPWVSIMFISISLYAI